MLAETAQLAVQLSLRDNLSPGLSRAGASLGALNAASAKTGTVMGTLHTAVGRVGSRLGSIINGPLGFLGLGAAIGTVGGLFATSVHKIEDFGLALEKVKTLTGETDLASGALILQFQKFGIEADGIAKIVGFTEKSLGKLNETASAAGSSTSKLMELDKAYGLNLIDANGKVADFSTVLGELATFYDSNAQASTKAYVASQVFGRGYTQMIPLLNEGSAGLRQAAEDAKSLGLNSSETAKQIVAFHDQMHAFENQVNVLQLAVGTALLPTLIELTQTATDFVKNNREGIVKFFKDGAAFAKDFASALRPVVDFFGGVLSAWKALPDDLKSALVGGFVANKATKFLTGSSLFDIGKGVLGLAGIGRGSTPANPVYTSDVMGGLGKTGALATAMKGALAFLPAAIAVAVASALAIKLGQQSGEVNAQGEALVTQAGAFVKNPQTTTSQLKNAMATIRAQKADPLNAIALTLTNPLNHGLDHLNATETEIRNRLLHGSITWEPKYPLIGPSVESLIARAVEKGTKDGLIHSNLFGKAAGARERAGRELTSQVIADYLKGSAKVSKNDAFVSGQAMTLQAINHLRTPGDEKRDLASANRELAQLVALQRRFQATGDTKAAAKIGADIKSLRNAMQVALNLSVTISSSSVEKTKVYRERIGATKAVNGNIQNGAAAI